MGKKIFLKVVISVLSIMFFIHAISIAMGIKFATGPLQKRKLLVKDGEFLKYKWNFGTEKSDDDYFVYRTDNISNTLTLYWFCKDVKGKVVVPDHYTNYNRRVKVSLDKASILYFTRDNTKETIANNEKGVIAESLNIDYSTGEAEYLSKSWDGNQTTCQKTRVKIKPDYPVWELSSIAFVASRFMDIKKPGVLLLVQPGIIKEAVPVSFIYKGKEDITTIAGKFHTLKYNFQIADPFMGKLLENYVKYSSIWIEDSERALLIKVTYPGATSEIEEIGIWKDAK